MGDVAPAARPASGPEKMMNRPCGGPVTARPSRRPKFRLAAAAVLVGALAAPVLAQEPEDTPDPPGSGTITGDWGGLRRDLAERGFEIRLDYIGDLLGNLRGGLRRGATYQGFARLGANLDLDRALGLAGAQIHASVAQLHGQGLSQHYVGNLLTTSNIEGAPTTRLYTAWYQQELLEGLVSLRLGQLLADEEFLVSEQAQNFVNATFGWPGLAGTDLRGGGAGSPLPVPGIRLRIGREDGAYGQVAVFNGDPAGGRRGDAQRRNPDGLLFPVGDDAFVIGELGWATGAGPFGLPAAFKLGGWYHTGSYDDLRGSIAAGGTRRGNTAAYAVADTILWRPSGATEGGIGAFLRAATAPGGRNLVDLYLDAGLTWKGMLPGREEDVLGLGIAYARISGAARRRDREARLADGDPGGLGARESVAELTYAAQLAPGLVVQPTAQLVIGPGPEAGRRSAAVLGMRTVLRF
jgi:porin